MPSDRRMITLSFRDRTTTITIGMLEHLVTCASNHLFDIKESLITNPLDWESDAVRAAFENRLEDIKITKAGIHDALHIRDWIRDVKASRENEA